MNFEYERDTRNFYQNDATAQRYHAMFVSPSGWRNLPSRVVARREQRAIEHLLTQVPHRTALDIPAGTGKLAGIFAALATRVVASDVSASMLKVAEAEYSRIGYDRVSFQVEDATDLGNFERGEFDVAVCLRLMHRVPASLRRVMLGELARVAPHAIVSFGIENGFHKTRRAVRTAMFGGLKDSLCFCSMAEARAELQPMFEILERIWIAPALSQEVVFLLKSKPQQAEHAT
jgi:2-polyprenyl-3-methyl-5-hydroxy-6-metoxy-1,4-benzoquinol methylase